MTRTHRQEEFLPDFCGVRMLFGVVVLGEILAIVLTLASYPNLFAHLDELAVISLFTQWLMLSSTIVLCLLRGWLCRLPEAPALGLSYAIILLLCWGLTEVAWLILHPGGQYNPLSLATHTQFVLRSLAISAIVAALALRYFYVQYHWRQQVQAESRARIQALQARIRPHFLFNCMNTIASLTRSQPALAEAAVEDLADLFRASLADADTLVPLRSELELCRRYLRIEALRLGDRLRVEWDMAQLPASLPVPSLSLQPLIENAIYHGIEPNPAGGEIRISGSRGEGLVEIHIDNPLAAAGHHHQSGNRIAVDNIRERLQAQYGDRARLLLRPDPERDRFHVSLTLPLAPDA